MAREFWIACNTFNDGTTDVYECRTNKFKYLAPGEVIHCKEVIEGEITDKMRLDWLDKESVGILKTSFGEFIIARNGWRTSAKTPREAIDAAMKDIK